MTRRLCFLIVWGLALSLGLGDCFAQDAPTAAAETPVTVAADATAAIAGVAAPATPTAAPAPAHLAGSYDTGSTAWLMVSAALVFFMMPGLALFYGGMVRAKNVLNMFMCVMVCVPLVCVEWIAYGYSMTFAVPSAIAVDAGKNDDGMRT